MWNKINSNAPPASQMRPPAAAPPNDEEDAQEVASGAPNDEATEADGQDQGDTQDGAPGAQQLDPDIAANVDPNNKMQVELIGRVERLTPQDVQAFVTGVTPQAVATLKKILPELGFLLDRAMAKGGGQGAAPGAPPQPPPAAVPPPAAQGAARAPQSRLFQV